MSSRLANLAYPMLILGLLAAVIFAGAVTTATAMQHGFTPIENAPRAPAGH